MSSLDGRSASRGAAGRPVSPDPWCETGRKNAPGGRRGLILSRTPFLGGPRCREPSWQPRCCSVLPHAVAARRHRMRQDRSEEHTSELQSRGHLVCRLLLEENKDQFFANVIVSLIAEVESAHVLT